MTQHTKTELKRAGGVFLFFLIYSLLCCAESVHIKPVSTPHAARPLVARPVVIKRFPAKMTKPLTAQKITIKP